MTGEVLAMVSYPSYDNSRFARNIDVDYYLKVAADPLTPLVNHVTQSLYPPGSVWKLITSTGVLQEHVIDPNSTLNDPGQLLLPNKYAPNDTRRRAALRLLAAAGARQPQHHRRDCPKLRRVLLSGGRRQPGRLGAGAADPAGWASTTCSATRRRSASARSWASNCRSRTPGECPIRTGSAASTGENWSTGDTYNAAFGQGYVNVTPLQLASAVAAIVNGGTLYQPTLIHDFLDANGNVVQPFQPIVDRTVNIDDIPADRAAHAAAARRHDHEGRGQPRLRLRGGQRVLQPAALRPGALHRHRQRQLRPAAVHAAQLHASPCRWITPGTTTSAPACASTRTIARPSSARRI